MALVFWGQPTGKVVAVPAGHYINQLNFIATLRAWWLLSDELLRDLLYEAATSCWEQRATSLVREVRAAQDEDFARELQAWIGASDP